MIKKIVIFSHIIIILIIFLNFPSDTFTSNGGDKTGRKFAQRCYKVDPATFTRGEALTPYISEDTIQQ